MSDDGRRGLTLIGFLGSVFSPYYAFARRRGPADPLRHCALNVALYGEGGGRWALTERGRASLVRTPETLAIGPSSMHWDGRSLTVRIDEVTAPLPSRIRGTVRVTPAAVTAHRIALDAKGRHRWWPIAPCARIEVEFETPRLSWSGPAYFDTNDGDEALEGTFAHWHWCRAPLRDGGTAVLYEVVERDGSTRLVSIRCEPSGAVAVIPAPAPAALPPARWWRMPRTTRADGGAQPIVRQTLEDSPFYARSVLATRLLGEEVSAVHESLSLDRFSAGWVQALLPFRMPRALGAGRRPNGTSR